MDHLKQHIGAENGIESEKEQCRYCLKTFSTTALLNEHLSSIHPNQTKDGRGTYSYKCIICRVCIDHICMSSIFLIVVGLT